jgi:hypothetical protein
MTGRGTRKGFGFRSSDRFDFRSMPIYVWFLYRVDVNDPVAQKRRITCRPCLAVLAFTFAAPRSM